MFPWSWPRKSFCPSPGRPQISRFRSRYNARLLLEALETRDMLSGYVVSNTNYSGANSLGAAIAAAVAADDPIARITFSGVPASPDLEWLRTCVDFIVQRNA